MLKIQNLPTKNICFSFPTSFTRSKVLKFPETSRNYGRRSNWVKQENHGKNQYIQVDSRYLRKKIKQKTPLTHQPVHHQQQWGGEEFILFATDFCLVGGFNPSEKYARQIGFFPQFSGWKYNIFELPPPSCVLAKILRAPNQSQGPAMFPAFSKAIGSPNRKAMASKVT